ncbi:hypothetical protein IGI52_003117 [Enterococcus sp. DIV0187]
MTVDKELLLLKQYILNTYPKELEYVSATVIECCSGYEIYTFLYNQKRNQSQNVR